MPYLALSWAEKPKNDVVGAGTQMLYNVQKLK